MKKNNKLILLVVVIAIFLLAIFVLFPRQKPVNWEPTFINSDTNPYGTYITYHLLKDLFDQDISVTRQPIYNSLSPEMDYYIKYIDKDQSYNYDDVDYYDKNPVDTSGNKTKLGSFADSSLMIKYEDLKMNKDLTSYIFINKDFVMDKVDLEYLLDFVGIGNYVFISAEKFSSLLLDTLNINTTSKYFTTDSIYALADYPNRKYQISNIISNTALHTQNCKLPVRSLASNANGDTVFVEVKYGNGYFYFHCLPTAFTNLNQIELNKYDFAYRCLSYMPRSNNILWDEYQKQGLVGEYSVFRVLYNSKALLLSLFVALLGFLLFMIFRAKRTQRVIPILNPPVNSSIEFLETISNLYYRKKDFASIVEKRQDYFLNFVRKNYYISTEHIDEEFLNTLSLKSGFRKERLNEIIILYKEIKYNPEISNTVFLKYNKLLEEFYLKVRNK